MKAESYKADVCEVVRIVTKRADRAQLRPEAEEPFDRWAYGLLILTEAVACFMVAGVNAAGHRGKTRKRMLWRLAQLIHRRLAS